jgi:FlaA1/EpsC-like NDP-sugar epimerase
VGALTTIAYPLGMDRPEFPIPLPKLDGLAVLVTGDRGFVGRLVMDVVAEAGGVPIGFDLPDGDVRHRMDRSGGEFCIHLAAHKYATTAEHSPESVADLNIRGTANVARTFGPRCVLASTCKAADPMTVYGASKLIAERIVLNHGGRVVRLVNVVGSSGSVVELWAAQPNGPLPVTDCMRMWMTPNEAARLLVASIAWPCGRYALDVPHPEPVSTLAKRLYPNRALSFIPLRRGDRRVERLVAESEQVTSWQRGVVRIKHPAD